MPPCGAAAAGAARLPPRRSFAMNGPLSRVNWAAARAGFKVGPGSAWSGRWRACRSQRGRRTRRRSSAGPASSPRCAPRCARRRPGTACWCWWRASRASGRPGLARAFAQVAAADGALVLWGSAWEDGGAPPYWPGWRRCAATAGSRGAALARAAGPQAALLAPLLPELGGSGPGDGAPGDTRSGDGGSGDGGDPAGPGARFALFEAVCAVLDRASRSAPLVVVLDDLHAAGLGAARAVRGHRTAAPGSCWSPPTAPRRRRWTRRSAM